MRFLAFNQWKKGHTWRRIQFTFGIGKIDVLGISWWKGGRLVVTILGFGAALLKKE